MRRTTSSEAVAFARGLGSDDFLELAMEWISSVMEPNDVFEDQVLRAWAIDNGFVEKEEAK